ncbi:MAG: sulfurtransferase TusA family protein [Rhodospirillaceae bacterium]
MSDAQDDLLLDVRGLACPLPILRAKKMMRKVPSGGRLRVEATDPAAVRDFEAFSKATNIPLDENRQEDGPDGPVFVFILRQP